MGVFFRRRRIPDKQDEGRRFQQRSAALAELLPAPDEETETRVLDLGAASKANLEFFGHRGARITIADFYRSFVPLRPRLSSLEESSWADRFAELLSYEHDARFDLVLAWDLLNYLNRNELSALVEGLERYCEPGTVIHAFIATQRRIPPAPSLYRIESPQSLVCDVRGEGIGRPAPRYPEPVLLKLMPGFTVESRFQLRNGMLEYVFSYKMRGRAPLDSTTYAGRGRVLAGNGVLPG